MLGLRARVWRRRQLAPLAERAESLRQGPADHPFVRRHAFRRASRPTPPMTSGAGATSSASTWSSESVVRPRGKSHPASRAAGGRSVRDSGCARAQSAARADPRAVLDRYCIGCHDSAERAGGLALDRLTLDDAARKRDDLGARRAQSAHGLHAAGRRAAARARYARRASRGARAASRRRRARGAERGLQGRLAPEPRRVRQRRARSARLRRRRRRRDVAGRRRDPGLRQRRRGADRLADADRELHHRGAEDQPRSRRRSLARSRRRSVTRLPAARKRATSTACRSARAAASSCTHDFPLDATYELRVRARGPGPLAGQRFCAPPRIDVTLDGAAARRRRSGRHPDCKRLPGRAR